MNDTATSFEFGRLLCRARRTPPDSYEYVPLHADLERDPTGQPMFSLIQTGATGFLMVTAVWRATDAEISALRDEIARRTSHPNPEHIRLSPASVEVTRCDLLLGNGAGLLQTLASTTSSGMPPHSALFSVSLSEQQFADVAAAVNGRPGFLAVEYDAVAPTENRASARLLPLSARLVPWLRDAGGDDPQRFRSALEEAVQDGLAQVSVNLPDRPSPQMVAALYDRLLTQAATVLPGMIARNDRNGTSSLEVSVELVEEAREPLRPHVDLASLVLDSSRITVVSTPTTERAPSRSLRVELDFDHDGAPLAWVRVRGGDAEAVLRAPHFHRAELVGAWRAGPLTITAGFTNGASNHVLDIKPPDGSELRLQPEHLGLRALRVDAEPLAAAGVDAAEISLRYRPPLLPDEQQTTIRFHDHTWDARWWVVAGTSTWLCHLDFSWRAINRDGQIAGTVRDTTSSATIVLSLQGGSSHAADR